MTIHELVRVVTKMVLLYLNQLTTTSQWPALWVGVLTALGAAQSCGSEVLSEAVPPALQNLLLMLHDRVSAGLGFDWNRAWLLSCSRRVWVVKQKGYKGS